MTRANIALLFTLLIPNILWADQPRTSNVSIWAESDDVYVLHSHSVHAWSIDKSELKIISKKSGSEIFKAEITPFTALVAVEGGKYFAGLSDLQAGSLPHGYNFALFNPSGEFISRVYVSRDTEYCEKVRQSVSQYLGWFSKPPSISIESTGNGTITSITVQPLYHDTKPCKLPIGDHLVQREK